MVRTDARCTVTWLSNFLGWVDLLSYRLRPRAALPFKSDWDAPHTERQHVKFGRTKDLNKWSISTCLFPLIQIKNPWNRNHFSHNLQQTKFSQCPIFKHACLIGDTGRDRPVVAVLWKLLYERCTLVIYLLLYFHMYFPGLVLAKPSLKNGNWRERGKFSSGLLRYLHFCRASNQSKHRLLAVYALFSS